MKIAIMQPYLFPYLGYFSLIKNTDHFVFFDTPQYIRKGWINRNRILTCQKKDTYFTVPIVKCDRDTKIKDVRISYGFDWKEKLKGQLTCYKKIAPYYDEVMKIIDDVLEEDNGYISNLAIRSIEKTCDYLQLPLHSDIYSEMETQVKDVAAPDEWALKISETMGYSTYVNPPGGKSFFDKAKYIEAGINLEFLTVNLKKYNQHIGENFLPGLSILDVMMFCPKDRIKEMLDDVVID